MFEIADETVSETILPIFQLENAFGIRQWEDLDTLSIAIHGLQSQVEIVFDEETSRMKWLKSEVLDEYMKAARIAVNKKAIPCQITEGLANCLSIGIREIHAIGWAQFANSCINLARNAAVTADRIAIELRRISCLENQGLTATFIRSKLQALPDWAGKSHIMHS